MILFFAAEAGSTGKQRTLVVEDDASSREGLVRILELTGFEVLSAPTLTEGLEQLAKSPSTLILDLMLPDGNGMEILRIVRERKLPIRVAVVTGADRPMILEAQQLNPDALFPKPLDVARLLAWLKTAA